MGIWQGGLCWNRKDARRVGKLAQRLGLWKEWWMVKGWRSAMGGCRVWEGAGHCVKIQPEKGVDPQ